MQRIKKSYRKNIRTGTLYTNPWTFTGHTWDIVHQKDRKHPSTNMRTQRCHTSRHGDTPSGVMRESGRETITGKSPKGQQEYKFI